MLLAGKLRKANASNLANRLSRQHFMFRQMIGRSLGFVGTLLTDRGRVFLTLNESGNVILRVLTCKLGSLLAILVFTRLSSLFGQLEFK